MNIFMYFFTIHYSIFRHTRFCILKRIVKSFVFETFLQTNNFLRSNAQRSLICYPHKKISWDLLAETTSLILCWPGRSRYLQLSSLKSVYFASTQENSFKMLEQCVRFACENLLNFADVNKNLKLLPLRWNVFTIFFLKTNHVTYIFLVLKLY